MLVVRVFTARARWYRGVLPTGGRFESQAELRDGLRAAKVKHDDRDLRPALTLLADRGRLEWPSVPGGRRRPGWLVPSTEVRSEEAGD